MGYPIVHYHVPHTRGDEPEQDHLQAIHDHMFPTRVGMNRTTLNWNGSMNDMFPTRVGMNRCQRTPCGSPHECSPHAWG